MGKIGTAQAAALINAARQELGLPRLQRAAITRHLHDHDLVVERLNYNALLVNEEDVKNLIAAGKLGRPGPGRPRKSPTTE